MRVKGYRVQVATDPEIEDTTDRCFAEGALAGSSPELPDLEATRRLWKIRERLVGQSFQYGPGKSFSENERRHLV